MSSDEKAGSSWRQNIALILSVLSTAGTLIISIKSCSQDDELRNLRHTQNAIEHRPQLKVERTQMWWDSVGALNPVTSIFGNTLEIIDMQVGIKLIVKNNGTATARLLAIGSVDTLSGAAVLREVCFDESTWSNARPWRDFFREISILPNVSDSITTRVSISAADRGGTVHLLLLYENEFGIVFDTYYWLKFVSVPPRNILYGVDLDSSRISYAFSKSAILRSMISPEISRQDSKIYDADQSSKIKEFARQRKKETG